MAIDSHNLGSFVITPGEFGSFVQDVNLAVMQLVDDMIAQSAPEPLMTAYAAWVNDVWGPFYRDNESTFETIAGSAFASTLARAEALRQEYAGFRTAFESGGGHPQGVTPVAAEEGSDWKPLLWGGLIVAGLFGLGYVLAKVPRSSKTVEVT
jgi:hypothetical protein